MRHFLVAFAFGDLGLEVVAGHAFPAEKHVIEGAIKMIFADIARQQRAAFIERPSEDDITAHPGLRAARRYFHQVFSVYV